MLDSPRPLKECQWSESGKPQQIPLHGAVSPITVFPPFGALEDIPLRRGAREHGAPVRTSAAALAVATTWSMHHPQPSVPRQELGTLACLSGSSAHWAAGDGGDGGDGGVGPGASGTSPRRSVIVEQPRASVAWIEVTSSVALSCHPCARPGAPLAHALWSASDVSGLTMSSLVARQWEMVKPDCVVHASPTVTAADEPVAVWLAPSCGGPRGDSRRLVGRGSRLPGRTSFGRLARQQSHFDESADPSPQSPSTKHQVGQSGAWRASPARGSHMSQP